jgi:hypothetical protein
MAAERSTSRCHAVFFALTRKRPPSSATSVAAAIAVPTAVCHANEIFSGVSGAFRMIAASAFGTIV